MTQLEELQIAIQKINRLQEKVIKLQYELIEIKTKNRPLMWIHDQNCQEIPSSPVCQP